MKPVKEALLQYSEQQNPRARMILETVKVVSEDIKDTKADWDGADSVVNWNRLWGGGAKPAGSSSTKASYATGTDDIITSLPGITGATVGAVIIRWAPNTANEVLQDITSITARLDPNADGGGKEVTDYVLTLYRQAEVDDDDWTLEQITSPVKVTAPAIVDDVTFTLPGVPAKIGVPAPGETRPRTVIVIAALDGAGDVAGNVAWVGNSAVNTATSNGHDLDHENFVEINDQTGSQTLHVKQIQTANGLPRFSVVANTYSQQTIEFTGANAPTLDATPTGTVEFMLEDEEPGGATGQGYVRNNGSTTWVAFNDGQTVADLGGVSSTGPVYEMRYIATPSTDGFVVPTVYRMGVRELTRETLDGIARIGNPLYQLDPFTLKASIPQLAIELTRDGNKDYRDFATELFSDQHAGEIEFRVHYGHPDLDRKDWIYIDQFRLHDYETANESVVVETIHPLALIKRTIPKGTTTGQNAVVFSGATDTAKTVYGDILDTVGVADRYRGVELEPLTYSTSWTAPKIAKTIGQPRPAKDELDRVAFIDGAAVIPSGGRFKVARFWTSTGGLFNSPVEHFDDIAPISVSPHIDRRIISYRVPYGWSPAIDGGRGGFAGAVFQESTSGVSKLGHSALDPVQDLDAGTAEWLLGDSTSVGSVYGAAIARRTLSAFRQGAVAISFRADHPRPWLELGDVVEVKTDRFIGRGLETDRALRGRLSVVGPIIEHDMNGTEFTVWVPEIESALPAPSDITIDYGVKRVAGLFHQGSTDRPSNSTTPTALETVTLPGGYMGSDGSVRLTANWAISGTSAPKSAWFTFGGQTLNAISWLAGDEQRAELECVVTNLDSHTSQRVSSRVIGGSTSTLPKPAPASLSINTLSDVTIEFIGDLSSTGDTITLEFSRVEHLGESG